MIRHSTAHLLAYAVKSLFPDAQVTIGPVIEDGFFYDFAYKRPFTPEDLVAIEKKMAELAKRDIPVERSVMPRDEAVTFFKEHGRDTTRPRSLRRSPATKISRCIARATSSTSVAVRTCPRPASSSTSS